MFIMFICVCFDQPNRRIRDPYVRIRDHVSPVVWEGRSAMGVPIPIADFVKHFFHYKLPF